MCNQVSNHKVYILAGYFILDPNRNWEIPLHTQSLSGTTKINALVMQRISEHNAN